MAILLNNHGYGNACWQRELKQQLPEMHVFVYPDIPDRAAIHYALVWDHPSGDLQHYPNLRAVFSLGAGMEHLAADPALPKVPLVPLADPVVAQDMANHALYWVLAFHRQYLGYQQQQQARHWQRQTIKPTSEFRVGVLGLGRIGQRVAQTLRQAGYALCAWGTGTKNRMGDSANRADRADIVAYNGLAQLPDFLGQLDLVINCLPFTPATHGLINAEFLAALPAQSYLVNISRGAVIDESALLAALEQGQIRAAALDVFSVEPLPATHPFWQHPAVFVTPHMAGATYARSAARVVVDNIRCMEQGGVPSPLFDVARGY